MSIMTIKILKVSVSGLKHKALISSSISSLDFQILGPPDAISPETTVGPFYIRSKVAPLNIEPTALGIIKKESWREVVVSAL